jgi:pilus assembly protein Flp/PilA
MEENKMLKKFFKGESGQGMVEYGLIIAVVALVVVGGLALLGDDLTAMFSGVSDKLGTSTT